MPTKLPTPPEVARIDPRREESTDRPVISAKGTRDGVVQRVPRLASQAEPGEIDDRIAMIAHDLKTPLAIIMLESQLLGERFPLEQLPAVQHGLERIALNAAYIDRLIADLLDLASVESGQLQLRIESVDLTRLLRETIDRAVSTLDRSRVKLELRELCCVHGDRNRLERVLANFISNALKYSASPITVVLERSGSRARVRVLDQGRGLTPEQAATVFDRFRRGSNTRGRDGYGLGLYISRKIIDAHNGKIGVASTVGAGSEFFFELDTID